jgi:hypothetical protein
MFYKATAFNSADLNSWQTGKANLMWKMFEGAEQFDGKILDWDVSKVTSMNAMFRNALNFSGSLGSWEVTGVTDVRPFPSRRLNCLQQCTAVRLRE